MMTLAPGAASGDRATAHKRSDQVLLILEGKLAGEVGSENLELTKGDVIIIPAGMKHRFENKSKTPAVTFNVYAPPEYPADTKG